MPTTTRSSEPRSSPFGRRWGPAGACLAALSLLCGCVAAKKPEEFFQLSAESPKHRAAQTRFFETSDENELLSASAAVLQDLVDVTQGKSLVLEGVHHGLEIDGDIPGTLDALHRIVDALQEFIG